MQRKEAAKRLLQAVTKQTWEIGVNHKEGKPNTHTQKGALVCNNCKQ